MKNKNKKLKFKPTNFLIGLVFTLFFISIGVIFDVKFRPLYYFDIDYLNIPESSGYDKELIRRNYDALIDYNSPFTREVGISRLTIFTSDYSTLKKLKTYL